jgi:Flp pilus assembly pilin Flp
VTACTAQSSLQFHHCSEPPSFGSLSRLSFGREVNYMLKYFVAAQSFAMNSFDDLRHRQEGQTMAEYGVVLAVLTIATVGVFTLLSDGIRNAIGEVIGLLPGNAAE